MADKSYQFARNLSLLFSQVLWHILYFNMCTIWRDILVVPHYVNTSEILDKSRWFWLMSAPASTVQDSSLILSLVSFPALVEFLFCIVWICSHLKRNWKTSSIKVKTSYISLLLLCIIISVFFELQMYSNFLNMSDYYYLWQREFHTEIFAITAILFSIIGYLSRRNFHIQRYNKDH